MEPTPATVGPDTDVTTLKPEAVAKILGVGRSTVYRMMAAGTLPYVSVGVGRGRHRRITRAGLNAYLAAPDGDSEL